MLIMLTGPAAAQATHGSHHGAGPSGPYAGLADRTIKALSGQQIADLRDGRGMGLAPSAELNGYPGPLHVLEHGAALDLTLAQRQGTEGLMAAMRAEAVPLGEAVIEAESHLDRRFREGGLGVAELNAAVARIATLQGELRVAHLRSHLAVAELLTPAQIDSYNRLRGYAVPAVP